MRRRILCDGGREKEAQSEFLTLLEGTIRQPEVAQSVQKYQLCIDLAVAPVAWLMPSRMAINTKSTVGYNKQLKQATDAMKLSDENDVNTSTKKGLFSSHGWWRFKDKSVKQPSIKSVSPKNNSASASAIAIASNIASTSASASA